MWNEVTQSSILASMTLLLRTAHQQWVLDYPEKEERLNEIVTMVVQEFRAALASNPTVVMDPDENTLPPSCIRHVCNIIIFELKKEMDRILDVYDNSTVIRADVFLRAIWTGDIPAVPELQAGSPSYTAPEAT